MLAEYKINLKNKSIYTCSDIAGMKDKFNSNNKRIYVVAGSTKDQAWCIIIALVSERKRVRTSRSFSAM